MVENDLTEESIREAEEKDVLIKEANKILKHVIVNTDTGQLFSS
jgi:hypothetical protein